MHLMSLNNWKPLSASSRSISDSDNPSRSQIHMSYTGHLNVWWYAFRSKHLIGWWFIFPSKHLIGWRFAIRSKVQNISLVDDVVPFRSKYLIRRFTFRSNHLICRGPCSMMIMIPIQVRTFDWLMIYIQVKTIDWLMIHIQVKIYDDLYIQVKCWWFIYSGQNIWFIGDSNDKHLIGWRYI